MTQDINQVLSYTFDSKDSLLTLRKISPGGGTMSSLNLTVDELHGLQKELPSIILKFLSSQREKLVSKVTSAVQETKTRIEIQEKCIRALNDFDAKLGDTYGVSLKDLKTTDRIVEDMSKLQESLGTGTLKGEV